MTWQERALGDCVTFASGGTPNKGKPEYWNGEIPWVSSGEMSRHFIEDTSLHITEAGAQAGSRLVPAGTVFAVVRGMSLATEFRLAYATRTMAFNQDVKALTVKDGIDSHFLFSSLRAHANQIRDLSTEAAHGTKKLEMERLASFRIPVPEVGAQRRAADVVRNYDDLIESNRRRITLLEESARLLYREWFVNLRFPGYRDVLMRQDIPNDWTRCTLGDLATLHYGKALKDANRSAGEVPVYGSSGIVGAHDKALIDGPAIIVGRKGNVGSVYYSHDPCFAIDTVYVIHGHQVSYYLYLLLKTMNFVSSDSAVPGLSRSHAYRLPVVRPTNKVRDSFERTVAPMFEQIDVLQNSNKQAACARDELLPKLMSGAIRV